ncbi:hypothetical protein GTY65_00615 [Streptomyces sp. SID8379]|uniref:hypothetical protein n=1 Tax=unclassified Streptomyces TaxID=2593676 RepID=UPI00131A46DC|nr:MULTISPECIES: hypothetical protein [unclassified Streptomyces]MYW62587.1 hypothetical protein [Streptomyces sp. SID8379]
MAERSGKDALWNAAASHLTLMVVRMAGDHERGSLDETNPPDYAVRIIAMPRDPGGGSPCANDAPSDRHTDGAP